MKIIEILPALHPTYILHSNATDSNLPFFVLFRSNPNSASIRHKMLLIKSFVALGCIAKVYSSTATTGGRVDLSGAAARLLMDKPKPTAAELDAVVLGLVSSGDVVSAGFLGGSDVASLDSMSAALRHDALPPAPMMRRAVTKSATASVTSIDMVGIDVIPDEGAGIMLREVPSGPGSSGAGSAAPGVVSTDAMRFIISNIDTITKIVAVLNDINSKINSENYVDLIKLFDLQFNVPLNALATDALTKIPQSEESASRWKAALWELHLFVAGYVSQSKGIEDWAAFKAQLDSTLTRLVDYAMVARDRAVEPPPAAGTSNTDLEHQLQVAVVDTGCACFGKCLFRICGWTKSGAPVPTADPSAVVRAPADATRKAIELTLFVESVVVSIDGIVRK